MQKTDNMNDVTFMYLPKPKWIWQGQP